MLIHTPACRPSLTLSYMLDVKQKQNTHIPPHKNSVGEVPSQAKRFWFPVCVVPQMSPQMPANMSEGF